MRDEAWPDRLIAEARRGTEAASGKLMEPYRNDVRLVARSLIGGAVKVELGTPLPSSGPHIGGRGERNGPSSRKFFSPRRAQFTYPVR
jgi:hypothetical protein